jgi:hypothetical protein
MAWFEPLSSLDFAFLNLEDRIKHMHVGGLAVFEGPAPAYEALLRLVDSAFHAFPGTGSAWRGCRSSRAAPSGSTRRSSTSNATSGTWPRPARLPDEAARSHGTDAPRPGPGGLPPPGGRARPAPPGPTWCATSVSSLPTPGSGPVSSPRLLLRLLLEYLPAPGRRSPSGLDGPSPGPSSSSGPSGLTSSPVLAAEVHAASSPSSFAPPPPRPSSSTCGFPPGLCPWPRPPLRPSSASGECRPTFETLPALTTGPGLLYPRQR